MHKSRVMALLIALLLVLAANVAAQDNPAPEIALSDDAYTLTDTTLRDETDAFGQDVQVVAGFITNAGESALTNVSIFADVLAGDTIIGEGFGFLTDACGLGLLPDFAFQPGETHAFAVNVERFEDGDITRIDLFIEGATTAPTDESAFAAVVGIEQISPREVVNVEFFDDDTGGLRYGTGCDQDMFINQDWFRYDPETAESIEVLHPNTGDVTPALLNQLGLQDPALLNRSFLTFPPTDRRIIYQTRINEILTAEPDGSFKRLIWDDLSRHSLQGFIWLPGGRFLAYYFGAYGEDVRYFTASMAGQRVSASIYNVQTSKIVPGPTQDGARVVIAETFDDTTGYWLIGTFFDERTLLFEGAHPGNNYPAPLYVNRGEEDIIYIVRPVDGVPLLQCYDVANQQLNSLTALPLNIDTEHRAWTWLSPDRLTLALAADGANGGLWLIDLEAFGVCGAPLAG